MLYNADFEVYEPNLLGIYSDGYVNTKPSENSLGLLIDEDDTMLIDPNNTLKIKE